MKLFLFGGAETSLNQVGPEIKLIGQVIKKLKVKQVLHIPFARTTTKEHSWSGDWFHRNIKLKGVTYLNAKNETDIAKAKRPLIFVSGGSEHVNLLNQINSNPKLLKLIKNARYYIGESAGSMIAGTYQRSGRLDGRRRIIKGLNLVKNTIIAVHYTERKMQPILTRNMKKTKVKYGIGIDCVTALEFELKDWPKKFNTIGNGMVEIITKSKK
ncbi:MAG: Type 1 glutamine amidotransferase-like domain-containing protein [Patescibacteria group bacterium]|jgi:peptidase E